MSTDIQNWYMGGDGVGQLMTTTPDDSTNVIDHGPNGINLVQGLYLVIQAQAAWTNSTVSLTFTLEQSDVEAMTSETDVASWVVSTQPAAGELLLQTPFPTITERYTQLRAAWTTTETTGSIHAFLTTDPQANVTG